MTPHRHYMGHYQAGDMLFIDYTKLGTIIHSDANPSEISFVCDPNFTKLITTKFRNYTTDLLSTYERNSVSIGSFEIELQRNEISIDFKLRATNRHGNEPHVSSWCNERGMGAGITLARECLPVRSSVMELKPWLRAQRPLLLNDKPRVVGSCEISRFWNI